MNEKYNGEVGENREDKSQDEEKLETADTSESDTVILDTEENESPENTLKRALESPPDGEPTKKITTGELKMRLQYDGKGNFVNVTRNVIVRNTNKKDEGVDDIVEPMELHEPPPRAPPPLPPRPPSRSNSFGPVLELRDKSVGLTPNPEVAPLNSGSRENSDSDLAVNGFDQGSGKWEFSRDGR